MWKSRMLQLLRLAYCQGWLLYQKNHKYHVRVTTMSILEKNFKDKTVTKETKITTAGILLFPTTRYRRKSWKMIKKSHWKNLGGFELSVW